MVFIYQVTNGNRSNQVSYHYVRKSKLANPTPHQLRVDNDLRKKVPKNVTLTPGTVLDRRGKLICQPEYQTIATVSDEIPEGCDIRYKLYDGTAIFLYWNKGNMMMSTANSWDISRMSDFVKDRTYLDYFIQTCEQVGFEYEELDHKKMHNILFINPQIHFTENSFRIIHYSDEINAYPEIELAEDADTEYMTFDPVNKIIGTHMSPNYETIQHTMYNNRKVCISNNWVQSITNILEKWKNENVLDTLISELNDLILEIISDNEVQIHSINNDEHRSMSIRGSDDGSDTDPEPSQE